MLEMCIRDRLKEMSCKGVINRAQSHIEKHNMPMWNKEKLVTDTTGLYQEVTSKDNVTFNVSGVRFNIFKVNYPVNKWWVKFVK